tara:strand:+ start:1256 stop:2173 length:918 start_codon:yes stop_codon:yes gene_type:complete
MVDSSNETQGNPQIGMSEDSFESAEQNTNQGSEEFFNELDNQVNGGIIDETAEVTQSQNSGSEQVTHTSQDNGSENVELPANDGVDWKKRYEDSSREAVRLSEQYKSVEPFVPVLEAMKNDSGLVDHVRDYLVSGGKPSKTIQEQLKLDEDFVFDQQEAMTDPDSDSAKLMNAHVDKMVQGRVGQMLAAEKQRAGQIQQANLRTREEQAFKEKHKMSEEQFGEFKARAKEHVMTLEDVNYLLNRSQNNENVANSTKKDMLTQMKNVRNMPTSASGANSQGETKSIDDEVFNAIKGFGGGVDNLFG